MINKDDKIAIFLLIVFIVTITVVFAFGGHIEEYIRKTEYNEQDYKKRTIIVYDYNGKPIKSYTGNFKDGTTRDNGVMFESDDGRKITITFNSILINEENVSDDTSPRE